MLFDFIEKIQFGRYVRERAKNTLVLFQQMKGPHTSDEEVFDILIASSFEMLISLGFIDEQKMDTDTYVERLISNTKTLCEKYNKPFCLQTIAESIITAEGSFMSDAKTWAKPETIGRIVVRNVSVIISENI